jgi:hypothetical protein
VSDTALGGRYELRARADASEDRKSSGTIATSTPTSAAKMVLTVLDDQVHQLMV